MKKFNLSPRRLGVVLAMLFTLSILAQRPMEKLDRSVVAQKVSNGIFVNWRITADEWYNTSYRLYRNGTQIYETGTTGASNYLDASGNINSKYTVTSLKNGVESAPSTVASVNTQAFLEIKLRDIPGGKTGYYPNDATAVDLDGDGQYEVIIKRMRRNWDAECTDFTYFEAYKLDGTFMWAINVGPNITFDVEIDIAAYDFDGDGKAEVFMRSSDNTIFGLDINDQGGISVGDRDGDGYTNYRLAPFNGVGGDGFMNEGPEYLSLIDGMTGKELDWKNFIPRGKSSDWGDSYGHRANKFFLGAPYLDGKRPSLFIGRGIYTTTKMQTYDVVNKKLVARWYWEALYQKPDGSAGALQQGKWDASPKAYYGQGYHNYTIADVDGDGKDEINWGSMSVDDDGKPLYSTELGHGDAQHYGDLDPYRKGQEMFACNEAKPGTNLRDAKTGQLLYRKVASSDVGRAGAGNISDAFKGAEVWGGGVGLSATDKVEMSPSFGVAENYCIYWDGDLLQELCDHKGFSTTTGVGYGSITKFNGFGNVSSLLTADAYSCNYTKGTPCLQADILGDWREEAIWWRPDSMALRIYTTPYPTNNRIYTLMHDHQYRQAICWQMCGYNQPPHTSFYLGSDFPTPIPPKATNGKLVWNGASSAWDTSSANWVNGDDAAGILAGTSAPIAYANGKSVLFDEQATNTTVNITADLSPEVLTVSGSSNYTLGGIGALTGAMHLDKMGEGSLTLNGTHSYTGTTEIGEGDLWMTGDLTHSPVMIRRHANFGGNGTVSNGINTEYNAGIYVGGQAIADTLKVNGTLNLVTGAKLVFDLSDNPTILTGTATGSSTKKNDYLNLNGTLQFGAESIIQVNPNAGSLTQGKYLIAKANAITGDLSTVKMEGASGVATELSYDTVSHNLYFVVKGVRGAGKVAWSGKSSSDWDLAKSLNFSKDGFDDIFVSNDSVIFDTDAVNRNVVLSDSIRPAYVEVNSENDYTFDGTGALTGTMDLYKTNTGTLTINNRNTFAGKVTVAQGSLVLKYAPSTTMFGGIGPNTAAPAYFTLKDSASLQITTANEVGSRGLTVDGDAGGLFNVGTTLYWNGAIQGTKLTKQGAGTLIIGNNNTGLNETVIKSGAVRITGFGTVPYGIGKKVTLMGGKLEHLSSTGAYATSSHAIEVPQGATGSITAAPRCEYNGTLTGAGTLNWSCDWIRTYINGNWSAFSGIINITPNTANSADANLFIVNNVNGFPNATVNLSSDVRICYKNSTSNNGTQTLKFGMLTGSGEFYNAGLEVGALNTNGGFSGIISGVTSVKKVGTGIWSLSAANTYTGTTTVSAGTLTLNGSVGAGMVTVANGATLNLNGTVGGALTVSTAATVVGSGTVTTSLTSSGTLKGSCKVNGSLSLGAGSVTVPGNTGLGTITIGGNVSMTGTSTLSMQLAGGTSVICDKLSVTGALDCNGILEIAMAAGTPISGAAYQLFSAGSISGKFTSIHLPALSEGIAWDTTEIYTTGRLKVSQTMGVESTVIKTAVLQNPTSGLFRVYTGQSATQLNAMVSNMQGRIVYQSAVAVAEGSFDVDLTDQPNGAYLLTIYSDKGKSNVLKLIKKE